VSGRIPDPDVRLLASLSGTLELDYQQEEDPWFGSPFGWIKRQQSRRRGKIGEQLVAGFLAAKGFDIARPPDSEADLLVNGRRVEVKFSTVWNTGVYKFQQVRDQDYEIMVCLGLCPFDAHCWVIPKTLLRHHVIGTLGQHGGSQGRDTAWMSFPPSQPYEWLRARGGRLSDAVAKLRIMTRRA